MQITGQVVKDIFRFRWKPDKKLFMCLSIYGVFWVLLKIGFLLGDNFIWMFFFSMLGAYTIVAVVIPVLTTKRLEDIGITTKRWKSSVTIGILALVLVLPPLIGVKISQPRLLLPVIFLALTATIFEPIFFRGYMQHHFERAFGLIPSLILPAVLYALHELAYPGYHPFLEYILIGILMLVIYRLTRNVIILLPITFFGAIGDFILDGEYLQFPYEMGYFLAINLIIMLLLLSWSILKKKATRR